MKREGRTLLIGGALLLAAVGLYWDALSLPVIDAEGINHLLSKPSLRYWGELAHLLTPRVFEKFSEGGYRPLTVLVYFLILKIFGVNPLWYKLARFLLHGGSALLLFSVAARLFKDRRWAAVAATVYFVQLVDLCLVGTGMVNDVLFPFFCLAAMRCYLQDVGSPRASPWRLAAGLFYGCALLSKELSVLLPAVLLTFEFLIPDRPPGWRRIGRRQIPVWLVLLAYLVWVKWWIQGEAGFFGSVEWVWHGSLFDAASRFFEYSRIKLPGFGLAVSALWISALAAGWSKGRPALSRAARWALFCGCWALLALWPVLNIFPYWPRFQVDSYFAGPAEVRYVSFAFAGLAGLIAAAGALCQSVRPAAIAAWLIVAVGLVPPLFGTLRDTIRHSGRAHFVRELRRERLSPPALPSAAASLGLIDRFDPALAAEVSAVLGARLPQEDMALMRCFFGGDVLAWGVWKSGRVMRMLDVSTETEFLARLRAEDRFQEGMVLLGTGEPERALRALKTSIAADPDHFLSCMALREAYGRVRPGERLPASCPDAGPGPGAASPWPRACCDRPIVGPERRRLSRSLSDEALSLVQAGNGKNAVERLYRALEADPNNISAQWTLSTALMAEGKHRKALYHCERALGLLGRESPLAAPLRKQRAAILKGIEKS